MNQQRSRRFRSAQEARDAKNLEVGIRERLVKEGVKLPKMKDGWDSNVITPGTTFMRNLSKHIRKYIEDRMLTHPAWANIQVIFSDASIPGEGEHKIMEHIRVQRSDMGYDPNMVHVLHGLDADLIMLALATHEVNFYISREEVTFGRRSAQMSEKRKNESGFTDAQALLDDEVGPEAMDMIENKGTPLQRLSVPILREYLEYEFEELLERVPFTADLERVIDDVVFMCFFVGNDFLPHLPSLDIRDGALDYLFNVYKRILPKLGGYITNHGGDVDLSRVNVLMKEVAKVEDYVFQQRYQSEEREKKQREDSKHRREMGLGRVNPNADRSKPPEIQKARVGKAARAMGGKAPPSGVALGRGHEYKENARKKLKVSHSGSISGNGNVEALHIRFNDKGEEEKVVTKKESVEPEEKEDKSSKCGKRKKPSPKDDDSDADMWGSGDESTDTDEDSSKEESDVEEVSEEDKTKALTIIKSEMKDMTRQQLEKHKNEVEDNVRLHQPGWKDRYYKDKCKADDVSENGGRTHLFKQYIIGLIWVMKYYYCGVPSWKWYYPFHYAPFASDLVDMHTWFSPEDLTFDQGTPFLPVEQLLSVLPNDSAHCVPRESRWLMGDNESPIIDYYPKEVPCDPNGKAMPWLWVVLLPFIDETRLLAALRPTIKRWSKDEIKCNERGEGDGLYYARKKKCNLKVFSKDEETNKRKLPSDKHKGLCMGFVTNVKLVKSSVYRAIFEEPPHKPHRSIVYGKIPPKQLTPDDWQIRRPRLNRGGFSIAYMGGVENHQHEQRHGHKLYKHQNNHYNPNQLLPPNVQWQQGMGSNKGYNNHHRGNNHRVNNRRHNNQHRQPQHQYPRDPFHHNQRQNSHYPPQQQHYHQQSFHNPHMQRQWTQHAPPTHIPPPNHQRNRHPPPVAVAQPIQSHYSFNQSGAGGAEHQSHHRAVPPPPPTSRSGVDPSLMKSLRSQLANTIKQNRDGRKR